MVYGFLRIAWRVGSQEPNPEPEHPKEFFIRSLLKPKVLTRC